MIFLGTNDLADRYALRATDIARAAGRLVDVVRASAAGRRRRRAAGAPRLPAAVRRDGVGGRLEGAPAKSALLADRFRRVAEELACPLLDLAASRATATSTASTSTPTATRPSRSAVEDSLRRLFA